MDAPRPVLVVEDDADLRGYLTRILERQGHRVVAAASAEDALAKLQGECAMLAVLDVGLPGMDGFALVEHLDDDVPVIVVTGDPLRAKMRAFGRRERLTILEKPVTRDQLQAAVQAAL